MAKALTFKEFIEYANKYYDKGGEGYCRFWDRKAFDGYVKEFGPITKGRALEMFRRVRKLTAAFCED